VAPSPAEGAECCADDVVGVGTALSEFGITAQATAAQAMAAVLAPANTSEARCPSRCRCGPPRAIRGIDGGRASAVGRSVGRSVGLSAAMIGIGAVAASAARARAAAGVRAWCRAGCCRLGGGGPGCCPSTGCRSIGCRSTDCQSTDCGRWRPCVLLTWRDPPKIALVILPTADSTAAPGESFEVD
jgi:hypothetical protein